MAIPSVLELQWNVYPIGKQKKSEDYPFSTLFIGLFPSLKPVISLFYTMLLEQPPVPKGPATL